MTLKQPDIPLFYNPTAGRGKGGRRAAAVSRVLDANGISHKPVASRKVGDIEELILTAIDEGSQKLLIAGGDGTVHEAVNAILKSGRNVEFSVIPVGTGNDFCKACAIPLHWEDAITLLADRMNSGTPGRKIDAGRCNDRFFANGLGIGFDAKVSTIARDIQLPIGDIVYVLAVFRGLWDGIATPAVSIRSDDWTFEGPLTLANFSNGPWVGGLFHIAPMAHNDDGMLDLIFAEAVTRLRVIRLLPKLMQGTHLDEPEVNSRQIRKCEVTVEEPVPSHLDGEIQPLQKNFTIEILAGALCLL